MKSGTNYHSLDQQANELLDTIFSFLPPNGIPLVNHHFNTIYEKNVNWHVAMTTYFPYLTLSNPATANSKKRYLNEYAKWVRLAQMLEVSIDLMMSTLKGEMNIFEEAPLNEIQREIMLNLCIFAQTGELNQPLIDLIYEHYIKDPTMDEILCPRGIKDRVEAFLDLNLKEKKLSYLAIVDLVSDKIIKKQENTDHSLFNKIEALSKEDLELLKETVEDIVCLNDLNEDKSNLIQNLAPSEDQIENIIGLFEGVEYKDEQFPDCQSLIVSLIKDMFMNYGEIILNKCDSEIAKKNQVRSSL